MGAQAREERIAELLEPVLAAAGLDLEAVELTPAGKRRVLRVVVDSENGVDLDTVGEVSQEVDTALESSDVMGELPYVLEVTSPGADRPLSEYRHFVRATGRLVKFHLTPDAGAEELVARIEAVDEDGLDLEVPGVKGRKPKQRRLPLKDIARARVEIEFNRKNASADRTQNEEEA